MFLVKTFYRNKPQMVQTVATWGEARALTGKHMAAGALVSEFHAA